MDPNEIDKYLKETYDVCSTHPDFKEYTIVYEKHYSKSNREERGNCSNDYLEESVLIQGIKPDGSIVKLKDIGELKMDGKSYPQTDPTKPLPLPIPLPHDLTDKLNELPKHLRNLLNKASNR